MRFEAPDTKEAAIKLLAEESGLAQILAGGTDLLVKLRSQTIAPDLILDIKQIKGMRSIVREANGWRIGAAVSGAELNEHAELCAAWPGVVEAAGLIGSTQVQGRATLVGNLCNASPAADSVPAMIAANAIAHVVGSDGERDILAQNVPTGVGTNSLAKAEFITSIFLPDPDIPNDCQKGKGHGDAYLRFIPRTEMDIAVVGCGVSLCLDASGVCRCARVALGAVATTALLVKEAEAVLVGQVIDSACLDQLADVCSKVAQPISDKRGTAEFRTHVVGVLARRATKIAADRAA